MQMSFYHLQNIISTIEQGLIFAQEEEKAFFHVCMLCISMHAKLSNYALCSLATMKDDFRRWWLQSSSTVSRVDITHQVGPKIIYVGVRFLSVPWLRVLLCAHKVVVGRITRVISFSFFVPTRRYKIASFGGTAEKETKIKEKHLSYTISYNMASVASGSARFPLSFSRFTEF